jgi:hypothetical protein
VGECNGLLENDGFHGQERVHCAGCTLGQQRINELAQGIEDLLLVATVDTDDDGYVLAYHFKTGALHRLLAKARAYAPGTNRLIDRSVTLACDVCGGRSLPAEPGQPGNGEGK